MGLFPNIITVWQKMNDKKEEWAYEACYVKLFTAAISIAVS